MAAAAGGPEPQMGDGGVTGRSPIITRTDVLPATRHRYYDHAGGPAFTSRRTPGRPVGMEAAGTRPLAVVTGASIGIGYELARQFAENGFDLVVCAEDDAIVTAARELEDLGASTEAVQADLTTPAGGGPPAPRRR